MPQTPRHIDIAGAGLVGLAAGITARRGGATVTLHERRNDVGHRFYGELEGLENWTTDRDVLEELAAAGIEPTFEYVPFYEVVLFDADRREYHCRDTNPIFYLVERGPAGASIDRGLRRQAQSLGVQFASADFCAHMLDGGSIATGPQHADVISVGYLFETDAVDGAYFALSVKLAAQGYAYLLVHNGRGIVGACLFDDFHNERYYLDETVEFFTSVLGITMRHQRQFGSAGDYSMSTAGRSDGLLYASESAGFQDAFSGLGMRYALLSGHLAAKALLTGEPDRYDELWQSRFGEQARATLVNHYIYARLGESARRSLVTHLAGANGGRARLRQRNAMSFIKAFLLPVARHAVTRRTATICAEPGCRCTWCQCQSSNASAQLQDANMGSRN